MSLHTLSSAELQGIKDDIRKAVDILIKGCESHNLDQAFEFFQDSPDFSMISMDGSLCDYGTYLRNNVNYLAECSFFELTTLDEKIEIFASDLAIFSQIYRAVATLKTGEIDVIDKAGASFYIQADCKPVGGYLLP